MLGFRVVTFCRYKIYFSVVCPFVCVSWTELSLRIKTQFLIYLFIRHIRGGADKSLARPGRKQATATKLGIYSTHSPRSSVYFLARCSNFFKLLKKDSESCPSNQVSAAVMTFASDEKMATFNRFSVQGTGGSPVGPDLENRLGDQDNASPGRSVSSGLQVPGEPGHCRARTRPFRGVFPSKCPSIVPAEMSNTLSW